LDAEHDDNSEILEGLTNIIRCWFRDFHIENLLPQHGVGSVAEGPLTLTEKFNALRVDDLLKIALSNANDSQWKEFFPSCPEENLSRVSRTIFVPKTATKLRTISMEPATLQYLQQGVMYELYKFIGLHPYLGVRIRLDDQSQNQILAWEGSLYHNYGTIDLSNASDSVSWNLVRRVFGPIRPLYKWLLVTRSRWTKLPTGELLLLKKFAPMGSALCFPIQCILFAAIVEYVSRKVCRRLHISPRLWSVYGDDLIVQSECYDETIQCLIACGFKVNTSKSYNTGEYRESCGKEYYAGVDISALTYRTPFYKSKPSPAAVGSWCSSANNAFQHRLPMYRLYLINKVLSSSRRGKPYFCSDTNRSPFLYSSTPTNFLTKKRWNKNYQRDEGRFLTVISKPLRGETDDDRLSYFIKLVEMAKRSYLPLYQTDESPRPFALHGTVEAFATTVLPFEDRAPTLWWEASSRWDT
jgi:YHS domain-containing protein